MSFWLVACVLGLANVGLWWVLSLAVLSYALLAGSQCVSGIDAGLFGCGVADQAASITIEVLVALAAWMAAQWLRQRIIVLAETARTGSKSL